MSYFSGDNVLSLKQTQPVIVHLDGETIKAGRGLAELLERPSLTLRPCYGLRTKKGRSSPGSSSSAKASSSAGQTGNDEEPNGIPSSSSHAMEVEDDNSHSAVGAEGVESPRVNGHRGSPSTSQVTNGRADINEASDTKSTAEEVSGSETAPEFDDYLFGKDLEETIKSSNPDFDPLTDLVPEGNRLYSSKQLGNDGTEVEETIEVFWPFEADELPGSSTSPSRVSKQIDWTGREALLSYVFFRHFALQPSRNTHNLLLVLPPSPPVPSPSSLAQFSAISFEKLNTPAFNVLDPPVAALFGVGATAGLCVHIGRDRTEINVVVDSTVKYDCGITVPVGKRHVEQHLTRLLLSSDARGAAEPADPFSTGNLVRDQLERLIRERHGRDPNGEEVQELAKRLAKLILSGGQDPEGKPSINVPLAGEANAAQIADTNEEEDEGMFNVAKMLAQADASKSIQQLKESKTKRTVAATSALEKIAADRAQAAQAAIAADVKTYTLSDYRDPQTGKPRKVTVGSIRHRACEPLYLDADRTIQDGMAAAVSRADANLRQGVWEGVVFVGELSRIHSLPVATVSHLSKYMLSSPDKDSEFQFSHARVLRLPDYFAHFKGHSTELAPFLGACVAAKVMFSDNNRHCITKIEYNAHGPSAINLALDG